MFTIGFQPIVANARPSYIDAYFYAVLTVAVEALVFYPIMKFERKKLKQNKELGLIQEEQLESLLFGYRKNKKLLVLVGATFGFGQILFFVGYGLAGSINGSLAQKSTVFFSLLFGAVLLHEKITKTQFLFSALLFFGLILAVTEGSFNLLQLNAGVLILLGLSSFWMLAHTMTKPLFDRKQAIPSQMVVIRNAIGAIILFSTYFIFYPLENILFFTNPFYIFWGFAMGAVYGTGLFFWYKTLQNMDVSIASILVSPTPIATALYATILLGEIFTVFHLIGTIIVIFSIIMIVKPGKKKEVIPEVVPQVI